MDNKKKPDNFKGNFSIFTITLVALVLVIFHKSTERGTLSLDYRNSANISQPKGDERRMFPLDVINNGLKNVYQSGDLNRQKTELENQGSDRNIDPEKYTELDRLRRENQEYKLQVEPRNKAAEIARENRPVVMDPNRIDTQVSRELANREYLDEYDKAYRKEWIRQYLENARRDGLEIILNDDMTVKEVRKITK